MEGTNQTRGGAALWVVLTLGLMAAAWMGPSWKAQGLAWWQGKVRNWAIGVALGELEGRKLETNLKKGIKLELKEMKPEDKDLAIWACTVRQDQLADTIRTMVEIGKSD